MAQQQDWAVDVRRYDPDADQGVIDSIIKYCGIALHNQDGQLVAYKDPAELDLVRNNYLKKHLGLTQSDAALDAGIAAVGERMKGVSFKNRVTVYYLLAHHFGALGKFGGIAAAAIGGAAAVSGVAGAGLRAVGDVASDVGAAATGAASSVASGATAAGGAALGAIGAGVAGIGAAGLGAATAAPAYATGSYSDDDDSGGGLGWLLWVLAAAALLAGIWWFFLRGGNEEVVTAAGEEKAATAPVPETTNVATKADEASVTAANAASDDLFAGIGAEGTATIPSGAGTTLEMRDGKPVAKVYFATAKTDVVGEFDPYAAKFKSYLDKNPGTVLGISGYNDPRGDAAKNAELSKNRAQAVQARMVAAGIPEASTMLIKPEASTQGAGDDLGARRVEVYLAPAQAATASKAPSADKAAEKAAE